MGNDASLNSLAAQQRSLFFDFSVFLLHISCRMIRSERVQLTNDSKNREKEGEMGIERGAPRRKGGTVLISSIFLPFVILLIFI